MNSSDNNGLRDLDYTIIYLYRYAASILYIFGNIGNMFNALVFARKSWRKNVCVFYFNICLGIHFCYINSAILGFIFARGYNINLQNSNMIICKLFIYIEALFSQLLPTVLILASLDRLLISSRNIDTRLYSSKRLAYFSISISTVFGILYNSHILVKVNIQELLPTGFICLFDLTGFYLLFISYSSLIITSFFSLSMIILLVVAFKNVRHLRAIPRQQRQPIRTMTKKDFQLLRCLFVHDIIYISCNIFLNVYYVYVAATINIMRTESLQEIYIFLFNILSFVHHLPYCSSWIIFIIVSKAFRMELKQMAHKLYSNDTRTIADEDRRPGEGGRDNVELNVVSTIVLPS